MLYFSDEKAEKRELRTETKRITTKIPQTTFAELSQKMSASPHAAGDDTSAAMSSLSFVLIVMSLILWRIISVCRGWQMPLKS